MKNELKTFRKLLSPDYPKCLKSQAKDEEINNSEDEDQIWRSREAFLKITLQVMRRMKHGELADSLQNSKRFFNTVDEAKQTYKPKQLKSEVLKIFYTKHYIFKGLLSYAYYPRVYQEFLSGL